MKAIAYFRVSSKQQEEKESIDLQKNTLDDFLKNNDYELVDNFDDDGISGESVNSRPGFQKALQRIEKGDVDIFLVYMIDRIGRFSSRKDRNRVVELLEDTKTSVHEFEDNIIYHWDNEKEINDLEGELNNSRLENVRRGKRISKGHKRKRLKGGPPPGRLPYGVDFNKKEWKFIKIKKEIDTLKAIFEKLAAGWGLGRVRDYLNNDPDRFPKRPKMYKNKPVTRWSAEHIRTLVLNDFYFTGKISQTEASIEKGLPPADTGLKLFDEDVVKVARREMRNRRARFIDPAVKNRQRTHSQQEQTVFTDALLHGIARCGFCGWHLGMQSIGKKSDKYRYLYYVCRGRGKGKCNFRNVPTTNLDKAVWKQFVQTLSNPVLMEKMILEQNFIVDKKLDEKRTERDKAKAEFDKITAAIERTKKQYQWGHYDSDNEYKQEVANLDRIQNATLERLNNLNRIINQPKDVRESVKKATQFVADQVIVCWCLERMQNLIQRSNELVESVNNEVAGDSEAEQQQKTYRQLQVYKMKIDVSKGIKKILSKLRQTRKGLSSEDRENQDILLLTYQQKRSILQRFVDHSDDKSIRVFDAKTFDINLYVGLDLFNNLGN